MINYNSVTLKDIVFFKDVTLNLGHKGITTISGRNLNASVDATNGAGKSTLVKSIPTLLFSSDPTYSSAKKSTLFKKGSSISLDFNDNDGNNHKVTKSMPKSGIEFDLTTNGEPTEVRTINYVENRLAEVVGVSEEEFYNFVYIDSRRSNLLQLGSNAKRFEFFTNLFKLGSFDDFRQLINSKIAKIKDTGIEKKTLSASLAEYIDRLHLMQDGEILKQAVETLRHDITQNSERVFELSRSLELMVWYLDNLDKIRDTGEFSPVESLTKNIAIWDESLKAFNNYKRYLVNLGTWKKETGHSDSETLFSETEYEQEKTKYDVLISKAQNIKQQITALGSVVEPPLPSRTGLNFKDNETPEEYLVRVRDKIAEFTTKLSDAQNLVKFLMTSHDHGSGECPVCSSNLDEESMQRILSSSQEKVLKLQAAIDAARTAVTKILEVIKTIEKYDLYLVKKGQLADLDSQKNNVTVELSVNKFQSLQKIKQALASKPNEVAPNEEPLLEDKNRWVEELKTLNWNNANADRINKAENLSGYEDASLFHGGLKSQIETLNEEKTSKSSELSRLSSELTEFNLITARVVEINLKIAALGNEADDLPLYELLVEAYSNKGLKNVFIQRIAKVIENNMNKHASLLFRERFKFTFEIDQSNFSILATRWSNGVETVSDVRDLSGAESRCFINLLTLAFIPLIPDSRRCNIIVLDEPTVNFDQELTELFCSSFLPQLNKVIPHIIIVTPLSLDIPNCKKIVVEKNGNESKLIEL